MRQKFAEGYCIGVKRRRNFLLWLMVNLVNPVKKYLELMANPASCRRILQAGAEKGESSCTYNDFSKPTQCPLVWFSIFK